MLKTFINFSLAACVSSAHVAYQSSSTHAVPASLSSRISPVIPQLSPLLFQDATDLANTGIGPQVVSVTQSCAGFESDPQSFSKRIAENFATDAFNQSLPTADSIACSAGGCVVHYSEGQVFPFDISVDLSQVPGVVSASGTAVPFALRPQVCSYNYSCMASGSVAFTRINCRPQ